MAKRKKKVERKTVRTASCSRCGKTKAAGEFHKHNKSKTGLQSYCKKCVGAYQDSGQGNGRVTRKKKVTTRRRATAPRAQRRRLTSRTELRCPDCGGKEKHLCTSHKALEKELLRLRREQAK
jgi:hypothetical protein